MIVNNFPENLSLFKTHFSDVLEGMLDADELGAFILVLANSMQDSALQQRLKSPLEQKFLLLKKQFERGELQAAKDDYEVFTALVSLGLESLPVWKYRQQAPWTLLYNPMRALRPARSSSEIINTLERPFNSDAFHFNKPFLAPEIFWQGVFNDFELRVFYNKFPFAPYHLLIVPEYRQCLPQYLTEKYHQLIWRFVAHYAEGLKGLGVAYNSLGAYASINQLHFQGFIHDDLLPIEDVNWEHNGGSIAYPIKCDKADNVEDAWEKIQLLHQAKQAYNLLYRAGACYVLERKFQGEEQSPDWVQGIAWCEVCGVQTVGEIGLFKSLNHQDIQRVLLSVSL